MIDLSVFDIPDAIFRSEEEKHLFDAMVKDSEDYIAISQKVLYCPDSGDLTWKSGRLKGKPAGRLHKSSGYMRVIVNGKEHRSHRIAFLLMHKRWPAFVDHINGIRTDNRACNLREATKAENCRNSKLQTNNSSGHPGVHWVKSKKRWRASIKVMDRQIHLGWFLSIKDAVRARIEGERLHHGEFSYSKNRKTLDQDLSSG